MTVFSHAKHASARAAAGVDPSGRVTHRTGIPASTGSSRARPTSARTIVRKFIAREGNRHTGAFFTPRHRIPGCHPCHQNSPSTISSCGRFASTARRRCARRRGRLKGRGGTRSPPARDLPPCPAWPCLGCDLLHAEECGEPHRTGALPCRDRQVLILMAKRRIAVL